MENFDSFETEKMLVQIKHDLVVRRKTMSRMELADTRAAVLSISNDVIGFGIEGKRKYDEHVKALKASTYGTGIAVILYLFSAFIGAPLWAQVVVLLLAAALIIITVYILMRSGDPFGNFLKLVQLLKEIWEIINDITPTPSHDCPNGQHWDEAQGKCVTDVNPVSPVPPGEVIEPFGDVELVKVGGEHQVDMPLALAGGNGWPGLTVKVMNPDDPNFDIQPNYIWAFWYDGQYAVPGWMISTQGYFNLDNVNGKNVITSIKDQPWIQPGDVLLNAVPLYLASTAKKENGKVIVHMKNGNRIEVK